MAYRRRYLSGQSATTVVIAQGAITSDKIVDGAVTHPKVAPSAIDSERILDGGIKSEDIGTGEVKTDDIASKAVTQEKIANNAVGTFQLGFESISGSKIKPATITADKMAEDVPTRPLTPGIATAEVQDGQITEDKLAADSVTEVKIKDGEISSSKYKSSSVDNVALKANAVHGTEILDGAVSTGKIGTDAVRTVHVQDGNITAAKLVEDFLHPYLSGRQLFFDEFAGPILRDCWAESGDAGGGGEIQDINDTRYKFTPDNVTNKKWRLNWNGKKTIRLSLLPKITVKYTGQNTTVVNRVGFYQDATHYAYFRLDTAVSVNWFAVCRNGGAETTVDTGIAATSNIILKIDFQAVDNVDFYIDGVLEANILTNVPTGLVEPWIETEALANVTRETWVYDVIISAERV